MSCHLVWGCQEAAYAYNNLAKLLLLTKLVLEFRARWGGLFKLTFSTAAQFLISDGKENKFVSVKLLSNFAALGRQQNLALLYGLCYVEV